MIAHHLLVTTLILLGVVLVSSNRNTGASFSPIRELGPSLAASVAGGTIIAARSTKRTTIPKHNIDNKLSTAVEGVDDIDDDECLVVLFRTPIVKESTRSGLKKQQDNNNVGGNLTVSSVFGYSAADVDNNCNGNTPHQQHNKRDSYYTGLSFLPNGPVNLPFLPNSSSNNLRILHAQSGLLIAATGFSPDVDHILNVAAGRVFSRISVYDAPSFISSSSSTSGKSVDPHRLVREDLSSMMIDAAMSEGARPLGIQLLVIGQSSLSSKGSNNSLEIYTIDPSGGFRSYIGRGSAIGRGAQRVCSSLMKEGKLNNNNYGWRGALDRAMLAAVDALESTDEDGVIEKEHSKYGAVVVFGKASSLNSRVVPLADVHRLILPLWKSATKDVVNISLPKSKQHNI